LLATPSPLNINLGTDRFSMFNKKRDIPQIENKQAVKYFAGFDPNTGKPSWLDESHAKPLFETEHPCVGELSVAWNSNLRQWLMLYNCNPGVIGRLADKPWGPWSDAAVIFDQDQDAGNCYFIHGSGDCGPPSDPESPANGGPGGVYAPFVIPGYTKGGEGTTTIYYMLSTWNPYQVVLMRSILAVQSDLPFGPDTCKEGFVWREGVPADHICVTPATRDATRAQNQAADRNREPSGGPFGPDTCLQGFVWRDDNATAALRRVRP
jgi:hypothetical protein